MPPGVPNATLAAGYFQKLLCWSAVLLCIVLKLSRVFHGVFYLVKMKPKLASKVLATWHHFWICVLQRHWSGDNWSIKKQNPGFPGLSKLDWFSVGEGQICLRS